MWLQICQGLMLLLFILRTCGNILYAANGREKTEPTGASGVFVTLVFSAMGAAIMWRSGAVSTILGGGQ